MKRSEVAAKYKWNLDSILPADHWEEEYESLVKAKDALKKYEGTLADKKMLLACFKEETEISVKVENLYVYAKMKQDENTALAESQSRVGRIRTLSSELAASSSFITPEIIASYSADDLIALSKEEAFSDYSYALTELARNRKRYLSDKEERILAKVSQIAGGYQNAFTMFDNADVRFRDVKGEAGETVHITHGTYSELLMSKDRRVRRDAYESMFTAYKEMINTIGALYLGNIEKDEFYAYFRGYKSALEMSMDGENVDVKAYENLLESVNKGIPDLHKYLAVREKKLGVDALTMYDMHVPVVTGADLKLSYEEAYDLVIRALSVLGDEYVSLLKEARDTGWIDVYETENKRSGAYSWGTYTSHPYVLLNYKETTHDVFTIAHELGHAMHSYKSNAAQPHAKAGYEIFVAEIASTVNEMLLFRYLLKEGKADRAYLLSYLADMFRTTFFRQTMFAEFELKAHERVEQEGTVTPDALCEIYSDLNKKYYGEGPTDELISYEWARIPHFYNSFYVYKYATGIVSAAAISADIFEGKPGALEGYMRFLSLGGSMPPLEILKVAGVDLTTQEPFEKAMELFRSAVEELAAI
ncbi:MAG: oligoendopeptidase F [Clostridia bacterium]|nr:oligoendopeptidase F [Clostridia bacterium]